LKIKFRKKRLRTNLIIGSVWVGLGLLSVVFADGLRWTDYGYFFVGLLYLGHYLYDRINHYLTIENGTLRKNALYGFGKRVSLAEIYWIKKFAGDYILKTPQREVTIDTRLIDEDSLMELDRVLAELDLPPDKTPFASNR
jgi:hypothetical protein